MQLIKIFFSFLIVVALLSCAQGKIDPFDRTTGKSVSDIQNLLTKNRTKEDKEKDKIAETKPTQIPQISKLIMTPPPPAIGGDKVISFSVTEQVPLKDVLTELGRVAKIDVDIDPRVSGGVIINARNRPLKEVIDRIATQGGLRYSYKNGVLFFEPDSPYSKNYFVDYITGGTLWTDVETNIGALLAAKDSSASSAPASSAASSATSKYTSNKSAGIINVYATQKQHMAIEDYLSSVDRYASAQVLIEAKVVEVSLSDDYRTGVDWASVGKANNLTSKGGQSDLASTAAVTFTTVGLFNSDINLSISALEKFGTTKTISSPRVHAINNQKARLNFADKLVYFQVTNTQSTQAVSGASTTSNVITTSNSVKQEEQVGVELNITPSINLRTREIVMKITPKLSVKSDTVTDPVNTLNKVPVIQTRELDTVAKVQDGNVIVIGGLMKQEADNEDSGIPYLNRIPVLGWLFKSVSKSSKVIETVIFIKATIVESSTLPDKVDRELQQGLDPNRRRFF